jgi:hypothetical protein
LGFGDVNPVKGLSSIALDRKVAVLPLASALAWAVGGREPRSEDRDWGFVMRLACFAAFRAGSDRGFMGMGDCNKMLAILDFLARGALAFLDRIFATCCLRLPWVSIG